MTAAVLTGAPSLSNHDDTALGTSTIDMGQRGHGLNASGYGSWPYILAIEFTDDNVVRYGGDSINCHMEILTIRQVSNWLTGTQRQSRGSLNHY